VAASATDARESGQGGLFGQGEASHADVLIPASAHWAATERMAQEREAFGFYFSAHPVDRYRQIARGRGARSFGELCDSDREGGNRPTAMMAALVEQVRWRDTRRGGRYVNATFSDQSGQFQASCFDEDGCKLLTAMAESGECALLSVELDREGSEDMPRVTVRGVQALAQLTATARMRMTVDVTRAAAARSLAASLVDARGGRGEVVVCVHLRDKVAPVRLGRDFRIDADLAEAVEALVGVGAVSLEPIGAKLALVANQ